MSYSFDDLVAHERRRWMQPWAIEVMSPAERRADFDRWRDRLLHPDRRLWNHHAAHAQRSHVNASPQLTGRRLAEPSGVRGAGPSLSDLLKLKSDAAALRVQLAVIKHEILTRKAQGLPALTEADPGWQIILKGLARYQEACRKARFNPDQPRVPAGNPDGGQWTDSGGGAPGVTPSSSPTRASSPTLRRKILGVPARNMRKTRQGDEIQLFWRTSRVSSISRITSGDLTMNCWRNLGLIITEVLSCMVFSPQKGLSQMYSQRMI
ncbi:MAG: hypothetical protein R3D62_01995 [Xanthobacteraceae bacterium]